MRRARAVRRCGCFWRAVPSNVTSRAVILAVEAALAADRGSEIVHAPGLLGRERLRVERPVLALDRDALRERRALWQHAGEMRIVPARREMNPVVVIAVAIDDAGERGERQVEPVERMREQHAVAVERLD